MTDSDPPAAESRSRSGDHGTAAALRERVADNLLVVVAALVLLAAVGGWVAYGAFVNPPTEPTERTVGSVETGGEFEYGAVVRSENPVYPVGSVLSDRDRFFRSVSPVLNGTFTHEYAADGEDVTAETTIGLRLRSADGDVEYWSTTRPLDERRVAGDAGAVAVPFEVNVTEAARTVARTDRDLGGSPGDPEVAVVAETAVTATIDGERVTATETHVLSAEPSGSTFAVDAAAGTTSERVTESANTPREYGPLASYGGALLFVAALASLALVVGSHLTGSLRPPPDVRRSVATARERAALDEWITAGSVPPKYRDGPTVAVSSLAGLVDVGIDSNRRVIEDDGAFYVVDDGVVYAFDPAASPVGTDGDPETAGRPADPVRASADPLHVPEDGAPATDRTPRESPDSGAEDEGGAAVTADAPASDEAVDAATTGREGGTYDGSAAGGDPRSGNDFEWSDVDGDEASEPDEFNWTNSPADETNEA